MRSSCEENSFVDKHESDISGAFGADIFLDFFAYLAHPAKRYGKSFFLSSLFLFLFLVAHSNFNSTL